LFLYVVTEPLLYGAFKTIIRLQFQAKSFFFFIIIFWGCTKSHISG
jgi:hypothetical protein